MELWYRSHICIISLLILVLREILAHPAANNAENKIIENANLGHVRKTRSPSEPGCSGGFNGTVIVSQIHLENQPDDQATLMCFISKPPHDLRAFSWRIQNIKTIFLVNLQGDDPVVKGDADNLLERVANNYSDTSVTSEIVITYNFMYSRVYECQAFSRDNSFCEDNIQAEFEKNNLQVAVRGDSFNLYCPGIITHLSSATWYKNNIYGTSLPVDESIIVSYKLAYDYLKLEEHYMDRRVTFYHNDAHLYFPKILLSDEGRYICQLNEGVIYTTLLEVHVRPTVSLSLNHSYIHGETIVSVSCILDAIRPMPQEFYWLWNGQRIDGVIEDTILDVPYNIRSVKNTISRRVATDTDNIPFSCVVDSQRYDRVYTGHNVQASNVKSSTKDYKTEPIKYVDNERIASFEVAILCILALILIVALAVLAILVKMMLTK